MGTFTDPRDGKTYKTVTIGKQTWMAENLNYEAEGSERFGESGFVNELTDDFLDLLSKPISNAEIQANGDKYGRLYDWNTAMKASPPGWHLPSKEELQELLNFAGGEAIAGKKLKAASGWADNGNGTDEYGFCALPGGSGRILTTFADDGAFFPMPDCDGTDPAKFLAAGRQGYWWTSTEIKDYSGAISLILWHNNAKASISYCNGKYDFCSVRCVKD